MDSPHILTRSQKKQLGDVESSNNVTPKVASSVDINPAKKLLLEESSKLQDNVLTPSKRLQPSRLSKTSLTLSNKTTEDNGTQNDESTLSQNKSVENNDELSQNNSTPNRVIPLWKLCDSPKSRKLTTILENGKENISLTQDVSVREDKRSTTRSRRRSASTSPSRNVVPQSRIMTRRSMRSLSESRTFPDSPIVEEHTKTPVKLRRSISSLQIEKTIEEEPTADIPIADANNMSPKMCNKVTTVHKTPPKENAKKSSSPLTRSKELENVADTAKENLHLKDLTIVDNTKVDVKESPEEQKTPPNKNVKNTVPSENKEPNMVSPVRKKISSNELNNANMSRNEENKLDSVIDKSNNSSSKEIHGGSNAHETSQKSPKIESKKTVDSNSAKSPKIEAGQKEKTSVNDPKSKLDSKAVTKIAGEQKYPEIKSNKTVDSNSAKSLKIEAGQKEKTSVNDPENKLDSKAVTKIAGEQKSLEIESNKTVDSNSAKSPKIEVSQKEQTSVNDPKNKLDSKAVTKIAGEQKSPEIKSNKTVDSNSAKSPKIEAGQKEKTSVNDPKNKLDSKAVTKITGEQKSLEIESNKTVDSNSAKSPKIEVSQKEQTSVNDPKNKLDSKAVTKIAGEHKSPEIKSNKTVDSNSAKSPKIEAGQKEKTNVNDPENKLDSKAVTKIAGEQKSLEIESNKTVDSNSAKSPKIEVSQKEQTSVNDPKNKLDSKAVTKIAGEQKSPEIKSNKTVDSNSAKSPKIEAGQKEKTSVNDPKNKLDSKAVTKITGEQKSLEIESNKTVDSNSAKSPKIEVSQKEQTSVNDPKHKLDSKAVAKITGEQKSPKIESKITVDSNTAKSPKVEVGQKEKTSVNDPKNKLDSKPVTKITGEQKSPEIESKKTINSNSAKSPKLEADQYEQSSINDPKNKLDSKAGTKITGEQKSPMIESKKTVDSNSAKSPKIEAGQKEKIAVNDPKNKLDSKTVCQDPVEQKSPEIESKKPINFNRAKSPKIEADQNEESSVNDPKNKLDSIAVTKITGEQKSPKIESKQTVDSNSTKSPKIEAGKKEKNTVNDPKNKVDSKAVTKITEEQNSPEIENNKTVDSNSAKSPEIEAGKKEKTSINDPKNKFYSKAITKITEEQNSPEIESNKTVDSNSFKLPKVEPGQKEQFSIDDSKNKLDSKAVTKITGEQKFSKIQSKKPLISEKKVQSGADGKEPTTAKEKNHLITITSSTESNHDRIEVVKSIVEEESEKDNDACSTEANFDSTSDENNEIGECLNSSLKLNKCLVNMSSPPTSNSKSFNKNSEETTIQLEVSNYNDEECLGTHKIFCDLLKDKCTGSPVKGNHISRTKEVSDKEVEELSRNVVEQSVTESLKSKIINDKAVGTTNSLEKIKVNKNKSNFEDSIGEISKVEPDSVMKNRKTIVNDGDKYAKSDEASDDESKVVDLKAEEQNNDKVEANVEQCSVILTLQNCIVTSGTSLNHQETSVERSNDDLGEYNNVNMQYRKNKMLSKKSRKSEVSNYTKETVRTQKESNKSINLPVKNIPKSINKRFCDESDSSDDTEQDTKKIKSLPKNIPKSINKRFCDESDSSDDTDQDTKKIKSLPKNIPKSINKSFCGESDSSDDTEQDTKKIKSLPSDDNSQSDLSEETKSSGKESIQSNQNFKKLKILFKKTLKNIDFKELLELLTIQNENVKSLNLNQNDLRKLKEKILISTEYKRYASTITKVKTKESKQMLAKQKKNEVKSEKPLHSDNSEPKNSGTVESYNKNKSNNKFKTLSSVHSDKSVDKNHEPKELNSTQGEKLMRKRKRSKSNKKTQIDSTIKEAPLTNIITNTADQNSKKFVIKNNETGKELNSTQGENLMKKRKRKRSKSNKKAQIDSTIKEAPLTNIISNTADQNSKKFVIKNNETGKELNSTQGENLMKKRKRSKSNKKAQIDSTIKEAPLTNIITNTADLNRKKFVKKNNETGIHQGKSKVNKAQPGENISQPAASNNKESAYQKKVTSQQVTKQKPTSEDKTQLKIKQEFVKENSALKSKPVFLFKFNENSEERKINKGFENKQTVEHKPVFMKQNESDTKKQGTGGESKKEHSNDNWNQKNQKKKNNKKAVQPTVLKTPGNLFKVEVVASSSGERKESNTKHAKEPLGFKVLEIKETPVEKSVLQANGNSEEFRKSKEYEAGLKLMKRNLNTTNVENNMFKFSQQPKKYQEKKGQNEDGLNQKKIGVKRLPTELLEALTDKPIDKKKKEVPIETVAPVEISKKKKKKLKLKSAILEESYIPLSTDSATQFAVARLDKEIPLTSAQQAANFRNNQLYGVHNRRISAKDLHNMKLKSKANNKE